MSYKSFIFILISSFLSFSSHSEETSHSDSWEPFNRKIDAFNNVADKYFLKPVAKGYQSITPTPVDKGISNFFQNTNELNTMLNSSLQAKPKNLGLSFSRFIVNLTLGFFGTFDVATELGIVANKEDFGQTFAVWSMGQGPYIVLPFFGPSTLRDGIGLYPDSLANPIPSQIDDVRLRNSAYAISLIDKRADLIDSESLITGDRYVFLRNAYLQNRDYLIHDGQVEDTFGDDVTDDDDWLE